MNTPTLAVLFGLLCILLVVRARTTRSPNAWARTVAFDPVEATSSQQLFGRLLGANLALLENDDFNQLGSALSPQRVQNNLCRFWAVRSREDCLREVHELLGQLGASTAAEDAAFIAWRRGTLIDSAEFEALDAVCRFLAWEARIVERRRIGHMHLTSLACDIQHLAYLVRHGVSAGYLSRAYAESVLEHLRQRALQQYGSWADFSLSALVGMGLRSRLDPFDLGDWHRIARSHQALMAATSLTLAHASAWTATPALRPRRQDAEDTCFAPLAASAE